ncbi:MAG: RNA 2',3'-cyclic phosphodiesterase [Solirubrobacterales bacterium]
MTRRLFIAMDLPDRVKTEVIRVKNELSAGTGGVKWVEDENLHITLKFLGDVEEKSIEAIVDTIRRVIDGCGPLRLALAQPGFFPNQHRARVIWIGMTGDLDGFMGLGERLDQALAPFGFAPDPRRKIHLTIGRVKHEESLSEIARRARLSKVAPVAFEALTVTLFESRLSREGPHYYPIEKYGIQD